MKSWVVGGNQSREKLRSLNLHLTKKAWIGEEKEGYAFVGDLSLNEQEFLKLSLEPNFVNVLLWFLWQEVFALFEKETFWII